VFVNICHFCVLLMFFYYFVDNVCVYSALQALDDISHGVVKVTDKLSELRFLKDTGRKMEASK